MNELRHHDPYPLGIKLSFDHAVILAEPVLDAFDQCIIACHLRDEEGGPAFGAVKLKRMLCAMDFHTNLFGGASPY